MMRDFGNEGRTVLFATHHLAEADEIADRVVVLNHGKVVADGPGATLKAAVATRRLRFVTDRPNRPELSELDGVTEVDICGTGVSIDSLDADATIRDLVGRGVPFRDLEITGAGLEQAFVALTGAVPLKGAMPAPSCRQPSPPVTLGRDESVTDLSIAPPNLPDRRSAGPADPAPRDGWRSRLTPSWHSADSRSGACCGAGSFSPSRSASRSSSTCSSLATTRQARWSTALCLGASTSWSRCAPSVRWWPPSTPAVPGSRWNEPPDGPVNYGSPRSRPGRTSPPRSSPACSSCSP